VYGLKDGDWEDFRPNGVNYQAFPGIEIMLPIEAAFLQVIVTMSNLWFNQLVSKDINYTI
jgi:hypothetical protein